MAKLVNIPAPTFTINGESYNEYELRTIFLEVAKGNLPVGLVVTDSQGKNVTIGPRGKCSDTLHGMSLSDDIVKELIELRLSSI